ncbi:MAG: hypothetical protein IJ320_07540 [Phascolarctobacterium sp.]|nr:hypothetical protein [Phascolarctobacterium sp.]
MWATVRFPEYMPFAEDWFALSYIYIYARKIVVLEKIYYFYNLCNESSICHQVNEKQYFYDWLCNRQQLFLLENELTKNIEYKTFWYNIVKEKSHERCLQAYKRNLLSKVLDVEQKQEMRKWLTNNFDYIGTLEFKKGVLYLLICYIPLLYEAMIYLRNSRKKLSYKIRSCLKNFL